MRPALVLAVVCAWVARAAAQPWPDDDRLVDDDPTVTCRSEHAAARPRVGTLPTCLRHARLRGDRIELLTRVAFEYDKGVLRPASFAILDDVAAILRARPTLRIEIQGHGMEENYGLKLSDRRARTVQDYLIDRGVDPRQLEAQGYGDTKPLLPWKHKDARTRNIRIELHVLPPPPAIDQ